MIKRFIKKEEGFTLIELLIVIIIIGILMAIGIPAYLTYQAKAKDTQAKNNLNLAWKAARAGGIDLGGVYKTTISIVGAAGDIQQDQPQLSTIRETSLTRLISTSVAGCKTPANQKVKNVYVVSTGSSSTHIRLFVRSDSGKLFALGSTAPDYGINNYNSPAYTAAGTC